jgi:hypothetical protein
MLIADRALQLKILSDGKSPQSSISRLDRLGSLLSEVLGLGFPDEKCAVILFSPDRVVLNGSRLS